MGLRAIADAEGIAVAEEAIRREAEKMTSFRAPKSDNKNSEEEETAAERIEDTKEWKNAKYALEMDAAVDWLRRNVKVVRVPEG